MNLRPGQQLRSTACTTEVVIVRAADSPIELACGGAPMVDRADKSTGPAPLDPAHSQGTKLGKRYMLETDLEVLVTRAGSGSLSVAGAPLTEKAASQLPASD